MCICANQVTLKKTVAQTLIGRFPRVPWCKTCGCIYINKAGNCVRHILLNMLANLLVTFVFEL